MTQASEVKNRIIPYQMLYEAISGTHSLVENIMQTKLKTVKSN